MPFTGKATYSAGSTLPEMAEDVADLVTVSSPFETPLLDALGDAGRPARATFHEWIEDVLLPNSDTTNDSGVTSSSTSITVNNGSRFRAGDQVRVGNGPEVILVSAVSGNALTVARGYGTTTASGVATGSTLLILGNAALEGDDATAARFTNRVRKSNYTQIFSATVEVSGSQLAARQAGIADELDYQKQQRLRELLRDLENSVINGRAAATNPEGSSTVRRTLRGILGFVTTNRFVPGTAGFPTTGDGVLSEQQLNAALREMWKTSSGRVDTIVVGGGEKRAINQFNAASRRFDQSADQFRQMVSIYESDYGVARVVLSRYVPAGTVLLIDSSRVEVMPLAGRSFQYRPLAPGGDRDSGQVIGEYTLELRNESAHGVISGLTSPA